MKIAQIAPIAESVPPRRYGGTERVVSYLTEELVRLGHEVTLFASGDSQTSATLIPCCPRALRRGQSAAETGPHYSAMLDQVHRHRRDFDVLHFHLDTLHFPLFRRIADRTLTTLHGRLDRPDLHLVHWAFPEMPLVSISNNQREPMPPVRWAGTVYHGLPPDLLLPLHRPRRRDYLTFLGRISPEKRVDRAIQIASTAGLPLKIAAKIDPHDANYFQNHIHPLLDNPLIEFIGEIGDAEKAKLLGGSRALLFPIDWPEPFGLVMVEALACGTPVIAWASGSVPEVIENGVTGFVVNTIDAAVEAVDRSAELDPVPIRSRFEERFTVERMATGYLRIYHALLGVSERRLHAGYRLPSRGTDTGDGGVPRKRDLTGSGCRPVTPVAPSLVAQS